MIPTPTPPNQGEKIMFNIPPRRESVRLNLSVSEEMYRKIKVIQFKHECTMAQVVEMLMTASIPEYFKQFPIEEADEKQTFLLSEGDKQRMCKNAECRNKFSYHKQNTMTMVKDELWCHSCVERSKVCFKCGEYINEEESEEAENDNGEIEKYHKRCYDKLVGFPI